MRAIGIYQAYLISWIEGNVAPNMNILLIPNENSGVNLLGMTLSFYIKKNLNGKLDMLINSASYRDMTTKNIKLLEQDQNFTVPLTILNQTS